MHADEPAPPGPWFFVVALGAGLLAGVAIATILVFGVMSAMTWASESRTTALAFTQGLTRAAALVVGALTVFPIGVVAALLQWPLFRNGVVSRARYATMGLIASLGVPVVLIFVLQGESAGFIAPIAIVCAAAGASGGFVTGALIRPRLLQHAGA